MTIAEFRVLVEQRFTIRCNNISERNAVLEQLILLGYKVSNNSMKYLVPGNTDDRFLHPVMNSYESIILWCRCTGSCGAQTARMVSIKYNG